MNGLTERESKMLLMLTQGKSAQDIAKVLKLTYGTLRVYLHNMYKKLNVHNKTDAVIWAIRKGGL